jgi:iron(III) transport system ATP-binding protein
LDQLFYIKCFGEHMSFLQVSGISRLERGVFVVKDISFTQQQFQQIAIAGETGSGKSSLLKLVAGLIESDGGQVFFEGKKIIGPADKLIPGHPGIAYLSQYFELPHFLQVEEVLSYASRLSDAETHALYKICRIGHLLNRRTDQLSGGEKQRIALARELLTAPRLLLLDEPFSNLDPVHKRILKKVLHDIGEQLNITCIQVSHDPQDTLTWADEIIVLKNGRLVQQGTPRQVYLEPVNEYVAGLFGDYNLLPLPLAAALGIQIPGETARVFVRPENFQLDANSAAGVEGTIRRLRYGGSFYEADIDMGNERITVKTFRPGWQEGATVYVRVEPADVWLLPA